MNYFNILFEWACDNSTSSIKPVFHLIKMILDIIRIAVPIILIGMTTLDIMKKVINPDDKDGQKKIMLRAIAALIVFLIPTLVRFTFKVIDWGKGTGADTRQIDTSLSNCWDQA